MSSIAEKISIITGESTQEPDTNNTDPGRSKIQEELERAAQKFIRVGDYYYLVIDKPSSKGLKERVKLPILKETIKDDYGKKIFEYIRKYYGFVAIPSHTDYKREIDGFYNVYEPVSHKIKPGDWPYTQMFLQHIFGEQYELGLDYLTILWHYPWHSLPVLALVSRENRTGKTTFVKWLKRIFGPNAVVIGNSELSSEFNEFLIGKLIVAVDETFIERQTIVEKIKNLATSDKILINAKHKNHQEVDFFGKIIILSNNVNNFITATEQDVRYWVRKVPLPDVEIPDLLDKMTEEIPYFLYFINNRQPTHKRKTRAWFDYDLILTDAFWEVVEKSKPRVQRVIEAYLEEIFIATGQSELYLTPMDAKELLFKNEAKIHPKYIEEIFIKIGAAKYLNPSPDVKDPHIKRYTIYKYQTEKYHDNVFGGFDEEDAYEDLLTDEKPDYEQKLITIRKLGRPYVFKKEMILKD